MSLLAKSCFAPGIISFVSNLIMSTEDVEDADEEEWLQEYKEGMGHEIYRKKLSIQMENRYFSDVVKLIYKRLNAIVFAIDVICNQKTIVRLNPADFLVNNIEENNIYVYCICPGPEFADQIETLDMSKANIIQYNLKKQRKEKEMEQGDDNERETESLFGDEAQLEEEKAGGTVKVASIKQRNF